MQDPSTKPERRYHPREEKMTIDKQGEHTFHVTLQHKSGPKVEGTGENLDELIERLREDLNREVWDE